MTTPEAIGAAAIITTAECLMMDQHFATKVLVPYAQEHLAEYVLSQSALPDTQATLLQVAGEIGWAEADTETLIGVLLRWLEDGRYAPPLRQLLTSLWESAYQQGEIKVCIEPVIVQQLQHWQTEGIELYLLDTPSHPAQAFRHTDKGDLTGLVTEYLSPIPPTTRGWQTLAEHIDLPPQYILCVLDEAAALDTAKAAGLLTCELIRSPEALSPQSQSAHTPVSSMLELPGI